MTKLISTALYLGFLPAPGTVASGVTFLIYYFWLANLNQGPQLLILILSAIVLWLGTSIFIRRTKQKDPGYIVADEVLASLVICFSIPPMPFFFISAFLIFRLLDITKWLGLNKIETLPATSGIMLDDLAAAAYT